MTVKRTIFLIIAAIILIATAVTEFNTAAQNLAARGRPLHQDHYIAIEITLVIALVTAFALCSAITAALIYFLFGRKNPFPVIFVYTFFVFSLFNVLFMILQFIGEAAEAKHRNHLAPSQTLSQEAS